MGKARRCRRAMARSQFRDLVIARTPSARSGSRTGQTMGPSGDALGVNDKSVGGGANEVERITGDQGKAFVRAGLQHFDVGWTYYPGGDHAIAVRAEQSGEGDYVVPLNVSQRPEKRVAVAGNTHVPGLAR